MMRASAFGNACHAAQHNNGVLSNTNRVAVLELARRRLDSAGLRPFSRRQGPGSESAATSPTFQVRSLRDPG